MLSSLYIENIAVAKKLSIDFSDGFTVITGKTGAGKSIIIDSLLLLCGAKNARELIRSGEDKATVSAIFSCSDEEKRALSEYGIETDENGEIEIMRTVSADGKSGAKINRRSSPLSVLKDAASVLIGIQTQNERSEFADRATYASLVDSYAGNGEELSRYRECFTEVNKVKNRIAELKKAMADREMMLDILRYQKKEIDSARLTGDDEEEKLVKLRNKIRSLEKVSKCRAVVERALSSNEKGVTAAYLIEKAENAVSQLSDVLDGADEIVSRLSSFRFEILDIAERVNDALDDDDIANPDEKLTQIERRLSLIEKLEKKYGGTIAEIKAKRDEIEKKISDLEDGDFRLSELEKELSDAEKKVENAAEQLSEKRKHAAEVLSGEIIRSLTYLDMPKVRFRIDVTPVREGGKYVFRPDGYDDVDLLISVNVGEEMQSLGKVSSGGELSRITLAVKTAFAGKSGAGCLVFDEIDTGVSGGTSEKIGKMLSSLAENTQVISVTHSPQIASIASCHLLIEKHESDGRTESAVREISGDERTAEIARIIGGVSVTEKQTAAAEEMLNNNKK